MNIANGLTIEVNGHPTEFGRDRRFDIYLRGPQKGNNTNTGVMLIAHDRGQEARHKYFQDLRREWADRYNVVAVGIDYLGSKASSRPRWRLEVTDKIASRLVEMIPEEHKAACISDNGYDMQIILKCLVNNNITYIPQGMRLINDNQDGGEYWDFGLVQSLDMIYAYRVVLELCKENDWGIEERRSYVFGYGAGGHIAQMVGRLAPSTFSFIADQAGKVYISPREMLPLESGHYKIGNVLNYNIKAPVIYPEYYSLNANSNRGVTRDMLQIRNLVRFIPETKCKYVMFSHSEDTQVRESSRSYLAKCMSEAGIDVDHVVLKTEKATGDRYEIDIKELFERHCDQFVREDSEKSVYRQGESDLTMRSRITFETANGRYVIDYSGFVPKLDFEGEVKYINAAEII